MSALQDFLSVQVPNEKMIREQLRASAEEVEKLIRKASRTPRTSAANVRIAQYRIVLSEIRYTLREMWQGELSVLFHEGIQEAAGEAGAMDVLNKLISSESGISRSAWEESMRQTAKNNVTAYRQRMEGSSYQPLSARVYRNAELSNGLVDRTVNNALLLGKSAKELADDVRGLIDPDVRGGISYAALRLGRTELNNAFHATAVNHHGRMPWVKSMRWNLSGSHPKADVCDGMVGTYKPDMVPAKPHPQCFCYVTPEPVSEDDFVKAYGRGEYDSVIDEILSESE